MHTTNYVQTFIAVSPDTTATSGVVPPKPGTVAAMQHEKVAAAPYRLTSDDLIFEVFADRNGIARADRETARAEFFSKGQPCMRSSPLVKSYGWGVHSDAHGRIAIYPVDSERYAELAESPDIKQLAGMRSSRK